MRLIFGGAVGSLPRCIRKKTSKADSEESEKYLLHLL